MPENKHEDAVKACYSTWSESYYEDYYGAKAAYPPIHRELLRKLLREAGVNTVVDAGCGPASFLREIAREGYDLYGFDLTLEMVEEAKKVMGSLGVPSEHIWEGSVLDPKAFRPPAMGRAEGFDAALCIGVLPHIPIEADLLVIQNLRQAVRRQGLVVLEARNQLFSLFTLNRYSNQFFLEELLQVERLKAAFGQEALKLDQVLDRLKGQFRLDLPPVREGQAGEPGYDQVLSRTHNPLVLREQFAAAGFDQVRLHFYHYHCLPPMFETELPELFRRQSLAMENPDDWRGYFMASAFLLSGRRV